MKHYFKLAIGLVTTFLLTIFLISSATAQSSEDDPTQDPRYKDPGTAQIVGIVIVGGGHFYAGESGTGALLLGSAILAPTIGTAIGASNTGNAIRSGNTSSVTGPVYVGLAVTLGAWIYSIVDSPKAAKRTNEKNGLTLSKKVQISPTMLTTKENNSGYGFSMKVHF